MSRLDEILDAARSGRLPPRVALAHVVREADDRDELARRLADDPRLGPLAALLDAHPEAWERLRRVWSLARHDAPTGGGRDTVAAWAAINDALARDAPVAGVALHALGDEAALTEATAEIVRDLEAHAHLHPDARIAEIGCGIGRFGEALAPRVAFWLGLDVSLGMLARARTRLSRLEARTRARTALVRGSGLDLALLAAESLDLVLFVDSFPYIVQAGPEAIAAHWRDAAAALKPGGALVVYNLAYDLAPDAAAAMVARAADTAALRVERLGARPFTLWDGRAYSARKPVRTGS